MYGTRIHHQICSLMQSIFIVCFVLFSAQYTNKSLCLCDFTAYAKCCLRLLSAGRRMLSGKRQMPWNLSRNCGMRRRRRMSTTVSAVTVRSAFGYASTPAGQMDFLWVWQLSLSLSTIMTKICVNVKSESP